MQLAVIESADNPFALTKYIDGRYFAIKELPTLTAALQIPLAELREILEKAPCLLTNLYSYYTPEKIQSGGCLFFQTCIRAFATL